MKHLLFCLLVTSSLLPLPIEKIAFGSCLNQGRSTAILSTMASLKPQLTIFMGDNIYADTTNMAVKNRAYNNLFSDSHFRKLKKSTRLLATWDDHDYGYNDTGADYRAKKASRRLFLRYFRGAKDPGHEGIYTSYLFGKAARRIQIILLDTRYFKSRWPTVNVNGSINADTGATMLGEAQWQWLEQQLRVPARLRLLVSSIQVLAENQRGEGWYLFKHEQQRLYHTIKKTGATGLVILSGDRHYAEVSKVTGALNYPLYDFTSSSFNQVWHDGATDQNTNRNGKTHPVANFGFLNIAWHGSETLLTFEFRNEHNTVLTRRFLKLSQLQ